MLRVSLYCIGLIAAYFMILPAVMTVAGYYPDGVGWKTAQQIVAKGGRAADCKKIIHLISHPLSPSQGEQRADCIYEYANLTKDPSACELLMPSSYGWSCLGAAEEPNARICWFDFTKELYNSNKPVMPECGGKNDSFSRRCCEMATMLYVEKKSDCSIFNEPPELQDQCLELVARRERNAKTCDEIKNLHVKSACQVAVQALQKK